MALPAEAIAWDEQRVAAMAEMKKQERLKLEAENNIKAAMATATVGVLSNGVAYTWKTTGRRGYVVEPTEYRDFRRKGTKDEKAKPLKRGQAPSIEDVAQQFQSETQQVDEGREDFDVNFD